MTMKSKRLKTPIISYCLVCGKPIINYKRRVRHFCSVECVRKRAKMLRKIQTTNERLATYRSMLKRQWKKKDTEFLKWRLLQTFARLELLINLLEERGVDINEVLGSMP